MQNQMIKNLQNVRFFNGLNEEQLEHVCNKSRILSVKKDDVIFCQGNQANAFFIIIRGWVTIAKENKDAEQSILHVFKSGDSFAEPAALIMGHYPASAYAASTCELLEINVSALRKLIQDVLPFNKTVLAAHLGVQPASLSRAFNQLTKYGVKSERTGQVVFDDLNRLRSFISET